jgi:hypothetical protein
MNCLFREPDSLQSQWIFLKLVTQSLTDFCPNSPSLHSPRKLAVENQRTRRQKERSKCTAPSLHLSPSVKVSLSFCMPLELPFMESFLPGSSLQGLYFPLSHYNQDCLTTSRFASLSPFSPLPSAM